MSKMGKSMGMGMAGVAETRTKSKQGAKREGAREALAVRRKARRNGNRQNRIELGLLGTKTAGVHSSSN